MIVDDEHFALQKIKEQISEIDFVDSVFLHENAQSALSCVRQHQIDVAILDIEMYEMNGIELAKELKYINSNIKIIFLTAHSAYAIKAFQVRANGYLLKPASTKEIRSELLHIASLLPKQKKHAKIVIQTFGNFAVFINGKVLSFERNKSKELLAYLVSRKGAFVNIDELLAVLYEDKPATASSKSQIRTLIASLTKTLKAVDAEELIVRKRNHIAINTSACSCDYYEFLEGNVEAINSFMGEFMSNYTWAEFITGYLESNVKK